MTIDDAEEGALRESDDVALPSGEALNANEASEITREGVTRLVILAGPKATGKTTLLTSLFEAFMEAPFANYLFGGSRTLVGFERRCFDGRVTSGRIRAHTIRTSAREGIQFLHLRLVHASSGALGIQNLLISDIGWELFRDMRDSTQASEQFTDLKRADHLCVVMDSGRLMDLNERYEVRVEAQMLLRSLKEAGMLRPSCQVDVVFSKWDLVVAKSDKVARGFIDETRRQLARQIGRYSHIRFFEVAARPESIEVPFAHGLPTLLRAWLEDPALVARPRLFLAAPVVGGREIERFSAASAARHSLEQSYDVAWV